MAVCIVGYKLSESLPLCVPETGENEAHRVPEECKQEGFHSTCKERMISIVFVSLADRHQVGAQRALTTFGHYDLAGSRKVCRCSAQKRKFETTRSCAGFHKGFYTGTDMIRDCHKRMGQTSLLRPI